MLRTEDRDGGAANVVNNVRAMGVPCEAVFSPSEEKVVKIRVIGKNQQMVRVDFDAPQSPASIDDYVLKMLWADIVLFSDYGKGALANVAEMVALANARGKTVLVDPKGYDYKKYRGADLVKPNLDEMKEVVGGWCDEAELTEKATRLRHDAGIGAILLTRASDGMTLYQESGVTSISAQAQEVFDVSGAGDTAIAAFAVALTRGYTMGEAAKYANKAAGIVVGRFGTAVATGKEVFGE
jgi:rfaE bifunctional protein kinase chain/domain